MIFEPRTSAPSKTNKYYLKAGKGGYNRAKEIDSKTHSCLPNCCGEVHGRWLESQKQTDYNKYDKLCIGNACSYYGKNDGYKRGKTPKLGAIGCYSGGKSGHGHVLFVEKIYDNGDILTSNSGYNGTRFFTKKLTKASNYSFGSAYKLQGFIYSPVDFVEKEVTPTVERDETKPQIKIISSQLRVRENHSTTSTIIGIAKEGGIYNYYETYDDSTYVWYRIADNQWVANNGKFLEVLPVKESDEELIKELEIKNKILEEENAKLKEELKHCIDNQKEYKEVYKCTKNGNYNIKIYLYENEYLYIK